MMSQCKRCISYVTSDPELSALLLLTLGFELRVLQRAWQSLAAGGGGPPGLDNLGYLAFLVTMVMFVLIRLDECMQMRDAAMTFATFTAAMTALTSCLQVIWEMKTGTGSSGLSRTIQIGGAICQIMGTLMLYNNFNKRT